MAYRLIESHCGVVYDCMTVHMPEQTCALQVNFWYIEFAQLNVRCDQQKPGFRIFCIFKLLQSFELSCLSILLLQFLAFKNLNFFSCCLNIFPDAFALFFFSQYLACFWYLQDVQSYGMPIALILFCVSYYTTEIICTSLL